MSQNTTEGYRTFFQETVLYMLTGVMSNHYVYGRESEYYFKVYFYGITEKQFVRNKVLQVVGTEEKFKNNKLILKVNYVTCKGLENVIFKFDVSEVK